MLDIRFIRENPELVKAGAAKKRVECDVDRILELDAVRVALQQEEDRIRAERKKLAKKGRGQDPDAIRQQGIEMKQRLAEIADTRRQVEDELRHLMLLVPNVPDPEVPEGESDEDNVEVRRWGEPREFDFEPRDHLDIALSLRIVDFERGAKVSGSRFYFLRGDGVRLEMALVRYALDILVERGFEPVSVPMLVKPMAMEGTGFLPRGEDEAYYIERDDLYLIGTSEVSLVSFHADEFLESDRLPLHYAGVSSCFRREAGAAGRDTRGLYRLHQFQKIEQVVFCHNDAEESRRQQEFILKNAEAVLQGLGLPYRVALACGAECGIPQALKYEIETWMPSRGHYCETMSCSMIHEFQARRLNIRYRDENGKPVFCHTLNNTGLATPRIMIPLLEHYQQEDGTVLIPEALRPYLNGQDLLTPPLNGSV